MKRNPALRAFTLAEMLIGMVGSTIIVGALLCSSIELQRSLHASEIYALNHADQRRLLDCLSRDLRRAIGIATATTVGGGGGTRLSGDTATIENSTSLVITLPGYYQSNSPNDLNYDQALPVVAADNYVDYGTGSQHAPGVPVIFRKVYVESEGCTCFVRIEGDAQSIIATNADNMHLTVTMAADGRSAIAEVTCLSPRHNSTTLLAMHDQILLRNIRLD
jgi:Tfp pilus assembly protein PilW